MKILAFSLYGPLAASHRVRLSQFAEGLSAAGVHLHICDLLGDRYLTSLFSRSRLPFLYLVTSYLLRIRSLIFSRTYDLAIIHCELLPFLPGFLERRLLRIPFIYDFDDAFYLKYRQPRFRWLWPLLYNKIDRMMEAAVAITAGSCQLAAYARNYNSNVTLLPSVVDTERMQPAQRSPSHLHDKPFTVGWIGSPSTAPYLQQLVAPLRLFARERPVRLLVVGGAAPAIPGVEVIEQPWSLELEVPLIQQFDVGVMPLPDTPWTRGKCAYKLIQCMACAIPVIASPVGANVDAVPPACGILASSPDEWLFAFHHLAADSELRHRMGVAGREWVAERYSLRSATPVLTTVIRSAVANSQA